MHIDRIKKFCLTVKENPWRNSVAAERFREAGLDVEFFYGLHGTTVGLMPVTTVWDVEREHTYRINPGKASITFSKIMLFQHVLDKGYDEVLILENDVKFSQYFKQDFEESYNKLPADWEAVHVGHCCTEGRPTTVINDRVSQIAYPLCCHALLFKREAVAMALEELKRNYCGTPSDTVLQRRLYPKVHHYCFVPPLVFQDATDSEAAKTEYWTDVQGWFDWQRIYDEQLTGFGDSPAKVAEVGCWKGRSTIYFADEIKRRLKNVHLYAVDTWRGNADEPDMQAMIEAANGDIYPEFIRNINRCGVVDYITPLRMPSVEGASQFADGELSFVFIDAGHSYEDVTADLNAWYPKVKFGSTIAGHDIARASVRKAVDDFTKKIGKRFRVWNECWILDGCHT